MHEKRASMNMKMLTVNSTAYNPSAAPKSGPPSTVSGAYEHLTPAPVKIEHELDGYPLVREQVSKLDSHPVQ